MSSTRPQHDPSKRPSLSAARSSSLLPVLVVLLWAMAAGLSADQLAAYSSTHHSSPDRLDHRAITESKTTSRDQLRDEHKPAADLALLTQQNTAASNADNSGATNLASHTPWCTAATCGLLALPPPVG
jgi:hypothetical protein